MDLTTKTDGAIETWIRNHEDRSETAAPLYLQLLEERARRSQAKQKLSLELSLGHLKKAAIAQKCTTYGALAAASGVEWSQARHQMNGSHGHLDRLIDLCHARGLPLLTAICVNQDRLKDCELGAEALIGFAAAGKRLGLLIKDPTSFHHESRDECWKWGSEQVEI